MKPLKINEQMKMIARTQHDAMLQECQQHSIYIAQIHRWPYALTGHQQSDIMFAVYESQWSREWQIFRLALKGLTTRQKLYHLRKRWLSIHDDDRHVSKEERVVKMRQIDNYINALKRGGQLDQQLFVAKER